MNHLGVQPKTNKKGSPKKKPVNIVYIANPKMVKTSASDFRELVQKLTGNTSCKPTSPATILPDLDPSPQISEGSDLDQSPQISEGSDQGVLGHDLLKENMETSYDQFMESEFSIESINEFLLMLDGFSGLQSPGPLQANL